MEIQVGEYVRDKDGYIVKVLSKLGKNYVIRQAKVGIYEIAPKQLINPMTKHSFKLIDLLEVGDFVNYERILDITGDYILTTERNCCKARLSTEIKSIVTKEQFESIKYEV